MSVLTHARPTYLGTAAERGVTTPSADAVGVTWWETDTNILYVWTGLAWANVSASGSAAWPAPDKCMIGTTQYNTFAAAVAAAGASDLIKVGEGTFACNGETTPDDVGVVGIDPIRTILATTASDTALTLGDNCFLAGLSVTNDRNVDNTTLIAVDIPTTKTARIFNVRAHANNIGTTNPAARGIVVNGTAVAVLVDTDCEGYAASGDGQALIGNATTTVYGGSLDGTTTDANGSMVLAGTVLVNVTQSGSTGGHYVSPAGQTYTQQQVISGVSTGTAPFSIASTTVNTNLNADLVDGYHAYEHPDTVKNTSGGAATAGDVGYIDEAGEYKTTTTAYSDVSWCVVLTGGANGADIYVARHGRVTVTLNGNNSAGDYLYTSTTAGQAQPQSYVRPELFAVALTANGAGAGGTCSALLLCKRKTVNLSSATRVFSVLNHRDTDFVSTINGAPTATTVVYGAVTSGAASVITPQSSGQLVKGVLWNTTRGTYRLIDSVNTGTSTITTVSSVDAWANTDAITIRSQTVLSGGSPFAIDLEILDTTTIPALATELILEMLGSDSVGYAGRPQLHPFDGSYSSQKLKILYCHNAGETYVRLARISVYQRRFCWRAFSSAGGDTLTSIWDLTGYKVAAP